MKKRMNRFRKALAWILSEPAIANGQPNRKARRDLARTLVKARPTGPKRRTIVRVPVAS